MGEGLAHALIAYLDTNVVLWLAQSALARISPAAHSVLEQAELLISPMVLIELEYLYEVNRIKLSARDLQLKFESEIGIQVCDLPFPRVAAVTLDEKWTRDPFDRMIVAQAKANGLAPLISADEEIRAHYPRTIW
jgi:PIN domain nuclease of toxin-antitoxin system